MPLDECSVLGETPVARWLSARCRGRKRAVEMPELTVRDVISLIAWHDGNHLRRAFAGKP